MSSFAPGGDPPPLKHDVGRVILNDGLFQTLIDDEVQSPLAIANQRWIIWTNDQGNILHVRDQQEQSTRQYAANSGSEEYVYLQFLALQDDRVWIQRHVLSNDDLNAGISLIEFDLVSAEWIDHGTVFADSVYQALYHNGVLLAFETNLEEFKESERVPNPVSTPDLAIDFNTPRLRYRLVSYDPRTREKSTIFETAEATGSYPAELIAGTDEALLWREDDYSENRTAFRSIRPGETDIQTLATFTIEAPSLESSDAIPFLASGKSASVAAWNQRGFLIEESIFTGGNWFAPNTKRTYLYRGFDGTSFEIATFETAGLALTPVTAVVGDFAVCRDPNSGELILANIDTRETRRVAIFP
jgi:hypothetical protein